MCSRPPNEAGPDRAAAAGEPASQSCQPVAVDPRIDELHRRAEQAGEDSYTDPATGYEVLTASFLRERGTCCDSGCRHCPYRDRWGQ